MARAALAVPLPAIDGGADAAAAASRVHAWSAAFSPV
jgi:hypothetical protein